jgi:Flp pilus assembly protein TadD
MKQTCPTVLRRRFDVERRGLPLSAWLVGLVLVAVFCDVWLVTCTSQVTLQNDKVEKALSQATARQAYLEAQLAGTRTRPALMALAKKMGMEPADPSHVIVLPAAYLADGDTPDEGGTSLASLWRRASDALVPKAMARGRP